MAVGMGSQMPPRISRAYVYKGTGTDQFLETPAIKPKKSKAEPKPRPKKVRTRRAKPRPKPKPEGWRPGDEGRAARARRKAEREEYDTVQQIFAERREARASPGWTPMTGEDIERLLNDV